MGKYEKLLNKLMEDPIHTDMDIEEVKFLLKRLGFLHRNKGSSHNIFIHQKYSGILVIPSKHGRHVKGAYIKQIRDAILDIEEGERL